MGLEPRHMAWEVGSGFLSGPRTPQSRMVLSSHSRSFPLSRTGPSHGVARSRFAFEPRVVSNGRRITLAFLAPTDRNLSAYATIFSGVPAGVSRLSTSAAAFDMRTQPCDTA